MEMAVAIGLAAWRVTSLLSYESGPFNVFLRFRALFGITHDSDGLPVTWPDNVLAKLLVCPLCLSIWVAAAMYGVWSIEPVVVYVIAGMGVAALVETWVNK